MTPAREGAHRVVVIGHGMVAHRFVEEVTRHSNRAESRAVRVTVLGDEPYHPYNRLLLSEVVAGRAEVAGLAMPETPSGVTVLSSTAAVRIDRAAGHVVDDTGETHPFDTVVLATGAAPRVPPMGGCTGDELPHGVMALRTVDDGRHLLATAATAKRAIVLGGGLLGVEAACALAGRGVHVTIVHAASHLMERQLEPGAAAALADAVRDLGLDLRTGAGAVAVHTGPDGRCSAMELSDGELVPADLVLLTVGVQPRTALAAEAGLPVDRGVLVGDDLRSPGDPRVAAIGDCAQPASGLPGADMAGLVAPGWEQAELLARLMSGESDRPPTIVGESAPTFVRLKAAGLDVVTVSRPPSDPAMTRTLSLSDPVGRRAVEVVVEGDRLVCGHLRRRRRAGRRPGRRLRARHPGTDRPRAPPRPGRRSGGAGGVQPHTHPRRRDGVPVQRRDEAGDRRRLARRRAYRTCMRRGHARRHRMWRVCWSRHRHPRLAGPRRPRHPTTITVLTTRRANRRVRCFLHETSGERWGNAHLLASVPCHLRRLAPTGTSSSSAAAWSRTASSRHCARATASGSGRSPCSPRSRARPTTGWR